MHYKEDRKVSSSHQQYSKTGQMIAATNYLVVCAVSDKTASWIPTT